MIPLVAGTRRLDLERMRELEGYAVIADTRGAPCRQIIYSDPIARRDGRECGKPPVVRIRREGFTAFWLCEEHRSTWR